MASPALVSELLICFARTGKFVAEPLPISYLYGPGLEIILFGGVNICYIDMFTKMTFLCQPLTDFVELISLVLVELWREVGAEGHDEEGDAEQGVHQVQHREEPEM